MKSYFPHYYEFQQGDWETFEELAKTVSVDAKTGRRTVEFNPEKFRREGDFVISNDEDRLHLCFSDDEVICVPEGNGNKNPSGFWEDSTRLPEYYNGTYEYLKSLGIEEI